MNEKEIERMLRHPDDETARRLTEGRPPLDDAAKARLWARIQDEMTSADTVHGEAPVVKRRIWPSLAVAAACVVVFGGTFAGLFSMSRPVVSPEPTVPTAPADIADTLPFAVGERFAADGLTESGTLWITVTSASPVDGDLSAWTVHVTAASEDAVPRGGATQFCADNFLAVKDETIVSPYRCDTDRPGDAHCTFVLKNGQTASLTLYYRFLEDTPSFRLATGTDPACPSVEIKMEGNT